MCKTKIFDVKLESLDPTGIAIQTEGFSMEIIDDNECRKQEKLVIHLGDCLYRVNNQGFIVERIVPIERITKEDLIEEALDIINSENSGLSHQQRLIEIEKLLNKAKIKMNEKDIVWHYENFLDIQVMVDEKMTKENLNPSNTEHTERIKEIITETVLEFKRWL